LKRSRTITREPSAFRLPALPARRGFDVTDRQRKSGFTMSADDGALKVEFNCDDGDDASRKAIRI